MMSPREQAQHQLFDWLMSHTNRFTAPYGIIESLSALPKGGKVRMVTFGVARYLDATATIWSPTKIVVDGQGSLSYGIIGTYASVDALIEALEKMVR